MIDSSIRDSLLLAISDKTVAMEGTFCTDILRTYYDGANTLVTFGLQSGILPKVKCVVLYSRIDKIYDRRMAILEDTND